MGLDWFVQPKEVDGRLVEPEETAGCKYLSLDDPESVELFRKIYLEEQENWQGPDPEPLRPRFRFSGAGIWDFLRGELRRQKREYRSDMKPWRYRQAQRAYWLRPFEEVVKDSAAEDPPPVVREASEECRDALARYRGMGDIYDFRANELREDFNYVTEYAGYTLKMQFVDELYLDKTPEEMLALAEDFSRALYKYLRSDEEKDQDSIDIVRAVVPWLRFWGRRGHSIAADF